jgi:hypothetical protein
MENYDTSSINGTLGAQRRRSEGTYTVDPDCTGTQQIVFPTGFIANQEIVIVDHAKEIRGIVKNAGFTVTFNSKKQ